MSETIVYAVITLGGIGVIAAVILYFVSQKFKVYEDPKIDTIASLLPGANCGGCGYAGCRALAEAIVKAGSTEGKACPAGGSDTGTKIAAMKTPRVNSPMTPLHPVRLHICREPAKVHAPTAA